jgi:transcriptional regulator with XRE-family HTH domain
MSRSVPALVTPALLVWARKRSGLTRDQAAKRTGIGVAVLERWESNEDRPTIAQVRKLGKIYKRPLAVFFLQEIPRRFRAMKCD